MTKIILALGLTFAASTAAFASSTALDVYHFPANMGSNMVTASAGNVTPLEHQPRRGDSLPAFASHTGSIDAAATASIGTNDLGNEFAVSPRAQ